MHPISDLPVSRNRHESRAMLESSHAASPALNRVDRFRMTSLLSIGPTASPSLAAWGTAYNLTTRATNDGNDSDPDWWSGPGGVPGARGRVTMHNTRAAYPLV